MTTFDERQARVQEIRNSIQSGAIETASTRKLAEYGAWLCDYTMQSTFIGQEYQQVCETIRFHMFRAMVEGIEQRGKTMQCWVVVLAVAALITSIAQTVISIRAEMRQTPSIAPPALVTPQAPKPTLLPSPSPSTNATPAASPKSK